MLKDVVKAMDKNGDQVIQYEGMFSAFLRRPWLVLLSGKAPAWLTSYLYTEFRTFVERTEKELFSLFHSIDRDQNGKLDKEELKAAFKRAGLTVPNSKLDRFFSEVDENHDVC